MFFQELQRVRKTVLREGVLDGIPCASWSRWWRRASPNARELEWAVGLSGSGYGMGLLVKKSMRSSRLGPWKFAGSGGNWPSPVIAPQHALSMD